MIENATEFIICKGVPDAAAPQTTPHTNGGQVTGFVSWSRIFHIFCNIQITMSTLLRRVGW